MSSNFANSWQKRTPGNRKPIDTYTQLTTVGSLCSYCTL